MEYIEKNYTGGWKPVTEILLEIIAAWASNKKKKKEKDYKPFLWDNSFTKAASNVLLRDIR